MVEIDRAEFEALVSLVRKLHLLFGDFLERLEKIEADERAREVNEEIQMNFLGQDELMKTLLSHEGFVKFFRKLNSERGGYRKALPIMAATFPRGKYVTVKSLMERLRYFGWKKKLEHYYTRLLMEGFNWHEILRSEEGQAFIRELFDYKLTRTWRMRPTEAFCADDTRRKEAFYLLVTAGLGPLAGFIREKTQ